MDAGVATEPSTGPISGRQTYGSTNMPSGQPNRGGGAPKEGATPVTSTAAPLYPCGFPLVTTYLSLSTAAYVKVAPPASP